MARMMYLLPIVFYIVLLMLNLVICFYRWENLECIHIGMFPHLLIFVAKTLFCKLVTTHKVIGQTHFVLSCMLIRELKMLHT